MFSSAYRAYRQIDYCYVKSILVDRSIYESAIITCNFERLLRLRCSFRGRSRLVAHTPQVPLSPFDSSKGT